MAIDSAAKRKSVPGICLTVLLSIAPDATQPQGWRQTAGYGYYGINATVTLIPPEDDDTKDNAGNTLTITAFTDCDGATVRPPRVTLLHAFDDMRNAALVGAHRLEMDRFSARSLRAGRLPNDGRSLRIFAFTSRAGEAFAPRHLVVSYTLEGTRTRVRAADTTNRTDCDGATLRVPEWFVHVSPNSMRNADLETVGSVRDRTYALLSVPVSKQRALFHRVLVTQDGRAGNAGAPRRLVLRYSVEGDMRVRARST